MSGPTTTSMHDARDAEDRRLLEAGDYAALVEAYYGVIVKRCQARTRNDGDAFDVASEVVVRLLGELKRGKRYPVPFRVVVHNVIGWKLNEFFTGRENEGELDEDGTGDGAYEEIERRHDLMPYLDALPARERDVAALRLLNELSPEQIATQLGITRNNVDQAWHRAKGKLREYLEAE